MSGSTELGRLKKEDQMVVHDAPSQTMSAVLSKLDEQQQLLKDLAAKLDLDTGVTDTDYATSLTDDYQKIELNL